MDSLNLVESSTLDQVDRQIIHGLTVDARASFRALGEVIGVSDQTVARRYRRLEQVAELRVVGAVDPALVGWVDWFLRLQCPPGAAGALAGALVREPHTRWVHLASGGTEIVCIVEARTSAQRDALFLRGFPGSRRVTQMTAHSLLHTYTPAAWPGLTAALSASQIARLRPPAGPPPAEVRPFGPSDEALLRELAADGRATHLALGESIGWHESTVRRRIHELRQQGVLHFEVDVDGTPFGISTMALLALQVEPSDLDRVGRALATHPEVAFAAATTGPANLIATVLCADPAGLYGYLTGRLPPLEGIRSVESIPLIRTLKRAGARSAPG